jgi:hypothetical protein
MHSRAFSTGDRALRVSLLAVKTPLKREAKYAEEA